MVTAKCSENCTSRWIIERKWRSRSLWKHVCVIVGCKWSSIILLSRRFKQLAYELYDWVNHRTFERKWRSRSLRKHVCLIVDYIWRSWDVIAFVSRASLYIKGELEKRSRLHMPEGSVMRFQRLQNRCWNSNTAECERNRRFRQLVYALEHVMWLL